MEQRSILTVTRLRVAIAVIAMSLSLLALIVLLRPSDADEEPQAHATAAPAATQFVTADATPDATEPASTPTSGATPSPSAEAVPSAEPTPETTADPASTPAPVTSAPPKPHAGPDVRLQIPSIGVDAWVIRMGLDANGVMEVPREAQLVAWYDFTSVPGAPGNAVMSAHLDYRGSTAVFWRLGDLRDGDRVTVLLENEPIEYVVSNIYSTRPEDADLREILGGRTGPETLTLITCGGVWDAAEGEYDHRVIVQATRVV